MSCNQITAPVVTVSSDDSVESNSDTDTISVSQSPSRVSKEQRPLPQKSLLVSDGGFKAFCKAAAKPPSLLPDRPAIGKVLKKCVAYEVFCGCARLTKALCSVGFNATGIDFKGNKDKTSGRSQWIDLTTTVGQKALRKLVCDPSVAYVHFAPPCGTATRARDRRRKNPDGTPASLDPKPLRSDEYPDGLPSLGGRDAERVQAANVLYEFTASLCAELSLLGIAWSVENPTNSRMWDTSWFRELSRAKANSMLHYERVTWDMCMQGGERDKATTFLVSKGLNFSSLALRCDGGHAHKPWGLTFEKGCIFATALERNYPHLLCRRIAAIVAKTFSVAKPEERMQTEKVSAALQPKKRHKPLVPEYSRVEWSNLLPTDELEKLKSTLVAGVKSGGTWKKFQFPAGSKLLDVENMDLIGSSRVKLGFGWCTREFIEAAKEAVHPFDAPVVVSPQDAEVLWTSATLGPSEITAKRERTIAHYTALKHDLADKEKELHSRLDPSVESIVAPKAILLFKRMLEDIEYDDVEVHHLLMTGVKLIGSIPKLPFWDADAERLPKITSEMLLAGARDAQKSAGTPRPPDELSAKLWDATMEEVSGGGLLGPFTPEEITTDCGPLWIPSRRFAVEQNDKLRPIDDFSEHSINAAFGAGQKVSMKGLDHVVHLSRARLQSVNELGDFHITDDLGNAWSGKLHPGWTPESWRTLVGRVADLKAAYKQLPVHPAHAAFSIVALGNGGAVSLFRVISLMFGTTAAVYALLRFSRAILFLGTKLLNLSIVEFFDDFSQVESDRLAESAQCTFESLLGLLGWMIADSDAKRKPFAPSFVSLGVEVDLGGSVTKVIRLKNKPGRVEAIVKTARALCLPSALLGFKDSLSLRGRIAFAEGTTHAKLTAPLARLLSRWASVRAPRPVSDELRVAIECAVLHLTTAGPRVINPESSRPPLLVFVDGACEQELTSIGGVLFDPSGNNEYFGGAVSPETVDSWKSKLSQAQVIGQAELFPLIVARLTWAKRFAGRRVIFFIDNESARICAIKAYSPVLPSLVIITQCVGFDYKHGVLPWYARVPTCCNVADGPSRMDPSEAIDLLGATCIAPVLPEGSSLANVLR